MKATIEIFQIDEGLNVKEFSLSRADKKYLEQVIDKALENSEELVKFLEEMAGRGFYPEFGVTVK